MRVKSSPKCIKLESKSRKVKPTRASSSKCLEVDEEQVTLEIDGGKILCTKNELIEQSGYFKAMFSHQYMESNEKMIKIKDNSFSTFNNLINLSRDSHYYISESELILALKNALIFQFDGIIDILVKRLIESLSGLNCLTILKEELPFPDINLRAKFIALKSFNIIKTSNDLLNFNLTQICEYLGSVYLKCSSELDVFETGLSWFRHNQDCSNESDNINSQLLMKLLCCLDYHNLKVEDISKTILECELVKRYRTVEETVKCITNLKSGEKIANNAFEDNIVGEAKKMVEQCRSRKSCTCLCIVLDDVTDNLEESGVQRKNSEKTSTSRTASKYSITDPKVALYYDEETGVTEKITSINKNFLASGSETGYVIGYNDCLMFLGTELELSAETYRYNYTSYDTVRNTWEKVLLLPPQKRKFFASLISGDILYIAGGIGSFRIVQDNLNSCNIKTGEWYGDVPLPYRGRQLICCDYLGSLFVINIADKAGYFFNTTFYTSHTIIDKEGVLDRFNQMFTVFPYDKDLYLIGNKTIIRMQFDQQDLHVTENIAIENGVTDYDSVEAVVCGNNVYCFYKTRVSIDDDRKSTLAKYNMATRKFTKIFDNISEDEKLTLNGNLYRLTLYSKVLALEFYKILEKETFVIDIE